MDGLLSSLLACGAAHAHDEACAERVCWALGNLCAAGGDQACYSALQDGGAHFACDALLRFGQTSGAVAEQAGAALAAVAQSGLLEQMVAEPQQRSALARACLSALCARATAASDEAASADASAELASCSSLLAVIAVACIWPQGRAQLVADGAEEKLCDVLRVALSSADEIVEAAEANAHPASLCAAAACTALQELSLHGGQRVTVVCAAALVQALSPMPSAVCASSSRLASAAASACAALSLDQGSADELVLQGALPALSQAFLRFSQPAKGEAADPQLAHEALQAMERLAATSDDALRECFAQGGLDCVCLVLSGDAAWPEAVSAAARGLLGGLGQLPEVTQDERVASLLL